MVEIKGPTFVSTALIILMVIRLLMDGRHQSICRAGPARILLELQMCGSSG
ncbi:Uncharacterised protein [Klebsiella pneumoniae]|nr:Uncharacterised protein [Klebsiella pneumoniae]